MVEWWNKEFRQRRAMVVSSPGGLPRRNEPIVLELAFEQESVHPNSVRLVNAAGRELPSQLFAQRVEGGLLRACSLAFLANAEAEGAGYCLYLDRDDRGVRCYEGIRQLPPRLTDGVRRLDTGHYVLELCRGTGDGTSGGKWGIRYFEPKSLNRNLIKGCSNAIGGVYGPFFTPSNGLVNPPEHLVIQCEAEVEGPILCQYRFHGVVPAGLDPNLRDKNLEIRWRFFYITPWFIRTYTVDQYNTVIDNTPVSNKITVGDEFESGQGDLVFSRFAAYGGTRYRTADPYARILAETVYSLLRTSRQDSAGLKKFREAIGDDLDKVSWDYFWRLFSVKEGVLPDDEIRAHVAKIVDEAHQAVHATPRDADVRAGELIDVSREPDQTIFALDATRTVELDPATGYVMV